MQKERYLIDASLDRTVFEFESVGPNGKIRKGVFYTLQYIDEFVVYNLGFGDFNEETGEYDDLKISNNGDKEIILATVAATVLEFTASFPDALVYAKGSTPGRTRMYQMALSSNFDEISRVLNVFGRKNGEWHNFVSEVNYEAFIVLRK